MRAWEIKSYALFLCKNGGIKVEQQKEKQVITYEQDKIQQVINILNDIPFNGYIQIKGINQIFDILGSPCKDEKAENININKEK
jgi:hypothetical protein